MACGSAAVSVEMTVACWADVMVVVMAVVKAGEMVDESAAQ